MSAEDVLVAPVRGRDFLVELFFIQSQGFVADVVVGIGTARVRGLREDVQAMPVGKGNQIIGIHHVFIGAVPSFRGAAADHVVARLCLGVVTLVAQQLQHLEG